MKVNSYSSSEQEFMTMSPAHPSRSKRPSGLRAEAKELFREAILRAAEAEFAERGFEAARIQDVAKRARIGVGTVYNHFDQKSDIVLALLAERQPDMVAALAARPEDPSDWTAACRARIGRLHAYVAEHRSLFALVCNLGLFGRDARGSGSPLYHAKKPLIAAMEALVREGVAAGALAGDPVRLARFLMGGTRALILGAIDDERADLAAEGAFGVDMFLRAAAPVRNSSCEGER
jgi:AcrR family transcriptional regulator